MVEGRVEVATAIGDVEFALENDFGVRRNSSTGKTIKHLLVRLKSLEFLADKFGPRRVSWVDWCSECLIRD